MEKTRYILKQVGFWHTFKILSEFSGYKTTMKVFHKKLNEISYYNAFIRIEKFLRDHHLIEIYKTNKKTFICLTLEGIFILNKIKQMDSILERKDVAIVQKPAK